MTFAKLKTKNQLTIPQAIVRRLHLKPEELFAVDIKENYIRLIPVEMMPKYTAKELKAIDAIVDREKKHGKKLKAGGEFEAYIQEISK